MTNPLRSGQVREGFTLIESLVVISIVALLIAILLPSLSKARDTASRIQCSSNLRQLGFSYHAYANANEEWFPLTHWVTQAGVGFDSGDDPLGDFGGAEDILICPDTTSEGTVAGYLAPNLSGTISGTRYRWFTYRTLAARGARNETWDVFGLHIGGTPGTATQGIGGGQVSVSVPRRDLGGQLVANNYSPKGPKLRPRVYIHQDSNQPLMFDAFKMNGPNYINYTGSHTYTNNHMIDNKVPGMNMVFLDGHGAWKPLRDSTDFDYRISLYGSGGWIYY